MTEIILANNGMNLSAWVDAEDMDAVSAHKWYAMRTRLRAGTVYAITKIDGRPVYLHRFIMRPSAGVLVDHIDGDGLNNRRANLRECSASQNSANSRIGTNTSGYRGVYRKKKNLWVAEVGGKNNRKRVGYFSCPREAAIARDAAALEFYGNFAVLNFEIRGAS